MSYIQREQTRREAVITAVYALLGEEMAAALRTHEDFRSDIESFVKGGDITPSELHHSIKDHLEIARGSLNAEAHAEGFRAYALLSAKEMDDLTKAVTARIAMQQHSR